MLPTIWPYKILSISKNGKATDGLIEDCRYIDVSATANVHMATKNIEEKLL